MTSHYSFSYSKLLVQNSISHFNLKSMKNSSCRQTFLSCRECIRLSSQYSTQHVFTTYIFSDMYHFKKAFCFLTATQNFYNNYKKHAIIPDKLVPAATQQPWPNSEEPYIPLQSQYACRTNITLTLNCVGGGVKNDWRTEANLARTGRLYSLQITLNSIFKQTQA